MSARDDDEAGPNSKSPGTDTPEYATAAVPGSFQEYWEQKYLSATYSHPPLDPGFLSLLQEIFQGAGGFVLDHGCGRGRVALSLAQEGLSVGINDLSAQAIRATRMAFTQAGQSDRIIGSLIGHIRSWRKPLPWAGFVSHRVFHTMPDLDLTSCTRSLLLGTAPGGYGIVSARSIHCSRFDAIRADRDFVAADGARRTFYRREPFRFLRFFERTEFEDVLKSAGFLLLSTREFLEATGNLSRPAETATNSYWIAICRRPQ